MIAIVFKQICQKLNSTQWSPSLHLVVLLSPCNCEHDVFCSLCCEAVEAQHHVKLGKDYGSYLLQPLGEAKTADGVQYFFRRLENFVIPAILFRLGLSHGLSMKTMTGSYWIANPRASMSAMGCQIRQHLHSHPFSI